MMPKIEKQLEFIMCNRNFRADIDSFCHLGGPAGSLAATDCLYDSESSSKARRVIPQRRKFDF